MTPMTTFRIMPCHQESSSSYFTRGTLPPCSFSIKASVAGMFTSYFSRSPSERFTSAEEASAFSAELCSEYSPLIRKKRSGPVVTSAEMILPPSKSVTNSFGVRFFVFLSEPLLKRKNRPMIRKIPSQTKRAAGGRRDADFLVLPLSFIKTYFPILNERSAQPPLLVVRTITTARPITRIESRAMIVIRIV